jgi:2-oxoglutarate ferredoxin oxidoreductase subunit beta
MPKNSILKSNVVPIWCQGCGLHTITRFITQEMEKIGWDMDNTVVISGIGCSGRFSGYFNLDALHTTHGRAIPVAEGIKLSKPDLNLIVFSGDGDLLGIGGNHLLHTARRNRNIKVFCNRNEVYAMTGGQMAPTTPIGAKTKTSGKSLNFATPINSEPLITSNEKYFYARSAISDPNHLREAISKSLQSDNFSFVDIFSICPTNYGRMQGFNNSTKQLLDLKGRISNKDLKLTIKSS